MPSVAAKKSNLEEDANLLNILWLTAQKTTTDSHVYLDSECTELLLAFLKNGVNVLRKSGKERDVHAVKEAQRQIEEFADALVASAQRSDQPLPPSLLSSKEGGGASSPTRAMEQAYLAHGGSFREAKMSVCPFYPFC